MYKEIFDEIVSIMHTDYAGFKDKKGWDQPEYFKVKINDYLAPSEFITIVKDYIADFKDPHMSFKLSENSNDKSYVKGFKVRRFEDKLYVTETTQENRINTGEKIISLDGINIAQLRKHHDRMFIENVPERENWHPVIMNYKTAQIEDKNNQVRTIELQHYEKLPYTPQYTVEQLDNKTALMTLTDFDDPNAINKLINENRSLLNKLENLIIDVRINYGGSDGAFYHLLPFLFPTGPTKLSLANDYTMEFNCTERNVDLMVKNIHDYLRNINDAEMKKNLKHMIHTLESNKGKGFVTFHLADEEDTTIEGTEYPKKVVVISDTYCGSAGDVFIEVVKTSPIVTVMGRATAGLNDYANLTIKSWDDQFELWYPVSRLKRIDKGEKMTGVGIAPHRYIPWTPEHIETDVDMEIALDLINIKH